MLENRKSSEEINNKRNWLNKWNKIMAVNSKTTDFTSKECPKNQSQVSSSFSNNTAKKFRNNISNLKQQNSWLMALHLLKEYQKDGRKWQKKKNFLMNFFQTLQDKLIAKACRSSKAKINKFLTASKKSKESRLMKQEGLRFKEKHNKKNNLKKFKSKIVRII